MKKAELRKFNLLQFLEHFFNMTERQEHQSLELIEKLIQEKRDYSDFVKKIWDSEHRLSYQHSCIKLAEEGGVNIWEVKSNVGETHKVSFPNEGAFLRLLFVPKQSYIVPTYLFCCNSLSYGPLQC